MKQNVIFSIGNLNDFFVVQRFFEENDILIFRMLNSSTNDKASVVSLALNKDQIELLIQNLKSFLKESENV